MKAKLRCLVAERNRLIHQDMADYDLVSEENCLKLIAMLDKQNDSIVGQIKRLVAWRQVFHAALKRLGEQPGEAGGTPGPRDRIKAKG